MTTIEAAVAAREEIDGAVERRRLAMRLTKAREAMERVPGSPSWRQYMCSDRVWPGIVRGGSPWHVDQRSGRIQEHVRR